jgi:hypothetical protein
MKRTVIHRPVPAVCNWYFFRGQIVVGIIVQQTTSYWPGLQGVQGRWIKVRQIRYNRDHSPNFFRQTSLLFHKWLSERFNLVDAWIVYAGYKNTSISYALSFSRDMSLAEFINQAHICPSRRLNTSADYKFLRIFMFIIKKIICVIC